MKSPIIYDSRDRYTRLHIKPPKRPMYLVIEDMINALGGYKEVAALCLVTPVSVNKWKGDPYGSGQDITVSHLQTLLATAGERLTNFPLQIAVTELLDDHFLNLCHRRAYLEEQVFAVVEMLNGNGRQIAERKP